MKLFFLPILSFFCLLLACKPEIPQQAVNGDLPLFPDYKNVTIPPNIAPLNFRLEKPYIKGIAIFQSQQEKYLLNAKNGIFKISPSAWEKLLKDASGKQINLTVYAHQQNQQWIRTEFAIHVSNDSIDSFLTYRRIFPGYRMWNQMGIYQRNLSNFTETTILNNETTHNNCMNCHSFCSNNGERMLFHQRGSLAGTYIIEKNTIQKISANLNGNELPLVYPYWHPSGRFIAFSTNETHQDFHTHHRNRIEVYDENSDIFLYDRKKEKLISSYELSSPKHYETYPTFTPDGKYLIFCSADSVNMPDDYQHVKYHLLRLAFDPETGRFATKVDTLFHAYQTGKSAKFPRISPDGKYLLYTISAYGNFSIWHRDANLVLYNLENGKTDSIPNINSSDVESYHSWSSNSRWFVFSSRRIDGLFTRPFLVHIDQQGKCTKPFLLPQESPDYYDRSLYSFNIPELTKNPTTITEQNLINASGKLKEKKIHFSSKNSD